MFVSDLLRGDIKAGLGKVEEWSIEKKVALLALGVLSGIALGGGVAAAIVFTGGVVVVPVAAIYAMGAFGGGFLGGLAAALLAFKKTSSLVSGEKVVPAPMPVAPLMLEVLPPQDSGALPPAVQVLRLPPTRVSLPTPKPRTTPPHEIPRKSPFWQGVFKERLQQQLATYWTHKKEHLDDLYWCLKEVNIWFKQARDSDIRWAHFDWFAFPWDSTSQVHGGRFLIEWDDIEGFVRRHQDVPKMIAENAERYIEGWDKGNYTPEDVRVAKMRGSLALFGPSEKHILQTTYCEEALKRLESIAAAK
ncbi:MAG: hypothetical protein JSR76_06310 [Verrucomicrobia bacterium]|nr:hypothetical protein [Verrucomicrobiota bacterium]